MPARDPAVLRIAALAIATALVAALALGLGAGGWDWQLIVSLRAPRVAAAAGVGSLLALAGLALQVLLRNPLADPYVLGHSTGASVGALTALQIVEAISVAVPTITFELIRLAIDAAVGSTAQIAATLAWMLVIVLVIWPGTGLVPAHPPSRAAQSASGVMNLSM